MSLYLDKEGPVVIKIKFRNPFWYTKGMGVRGVFYNWNGKSALIPENRMEKISVAHRQIAFHLNDKRFEVWKEHILLPISGYITVNTSAIEKIEVLADNYLLDLYFTNKDKKYLNFNFDFKGRTSYPCYDVKGKTNKCVIAESQRQGRTSFSWFFLQASHSNSNTISCFQLQLSVVEVKRINVAFDIPRR